MWFTSLCVSTLHLPRHMLIFPSTAVLGFSIANIVLRPYTIVPFILLANTSVAMIACKCVSYPQVKRGAADPKIPAAAGLSLLTNYLKKNKCTDLEKCFAAELEQMEYIRQTTVPITCPPILKSSCPLPKPKRTYAPPHTLSPFRSASPYSSTSTLASFS